MAQEQKFYKKEEVLFKVMNYDGCLVIEDGNNFYNLDNGFGNPLADALIQRIGDEEDECELRFLHEKEFPEGKKRRKEILKILHEYVKNPLLRCWWSKFCHKTA